jgi:hypothetical protein
MICSSLKRLRRMALLLIEGPNLSVAAIQGSTSLPFRPLYQIPESVPRCGIPKLTVI